MMREKSRFKNGLQVKVLLLWLVGALAVVAFAGCGSNQQQAKTASLYELESNQNAKYEADVQEFAVADLEYKAASGKLMPYSVAGVIGVPKGEGSFPLVLITHGSHSNEDESLRFDRGFTYLVEALAKNGYVAVSMDLSKAYIWKYGDNDDKEKSVAMTAEHLALLKQADEGSFTKYPVALQGKINFDQIALIGHSRGGDGVFEIALNQQKQGVAIKGVLAIAPTISNEFETMELPKATTAIIVPEYDGDVSTLDGLALEQVLEAKSQLPVTSTFLKKANHNYFNADLKQNDAELNRTPLELQDQLSPEQQRDFLAQYAINFVQSVFEDNFADTMFAVDKAQPNKMFGYEVVTRLKTPKTKALFTIKDEAAYKAEGMTAALVQDSWLFSDDKVILDTITFGHDAYQVKPLLSLKWQDQNGKLEITPAISDFSNYTALSLNLLPDSADSTNEMGKALDFSVLLTDKKGNSALLALPENLNALLTTSGKIDETPMDDFTIKFWNKLTPIGNLRIPLAEFEGVDLQNIQSVALVFDKTQQGSAYLEAMVLQ